MEQVITGIQQVGIGVVNANEAMHLYKDLFGMNVKIFDDRSAASLMTNYTGNTIYNRHAILTMNLSCGGGFEIWQYTDRIPIDQPTLSLGDIGIFAPKLRTQNIGEAHHFYSKNPLATTSPVYNNMSGDSFFWVKDGYGNHFQLIESTSNYLSPQFICGGVCGAVIGVSDIDKAIHFYATVLGIDEVVYRAECIDCFYGEEVNVEKVLLRKEKNKNGAFSNLLGDVQIELIKLTNKVPKRIFADRFWGDCGLIHLCFDVLNMDILKQHATNNGFNFTVDSLNSFAMENAAGRFCYVEDPDGTLIELVETHQIPIFKKINWHLHLKKRKHNKPLPKWMVKMLGLSKV